MDSSEFKRKAEKRKQQRAQINAHNLQVAEKAAQRYAKDADRSLDEILKATQTKALKAEESLAHAMTTLATDREKLVRIDKDADRTNAALEQSNKEIKKFNKFGAVLKSFFKGRKKEIKKDTATTVAESNKDLSTNPAMRSLQVETQNFDAKLKQLDNVVANLRAMNDEVGKELEEQDEILENINKKVVSANQEFEKQTDQISKVL